HESLGGAVVGAAPTDDGRVGAGVAAHPAVGTVRAAVSAAATAAGARGRGGGGKAHGEGKPTAFHRDVHLAVTVYGADRFTGADQSHSLATKKQRASGREDRVPPESK